MFSICIQHPSRFIERRSCIANSASWRGRRLVLGVKLKASLILRFLTSDFLYQGFSLRSFEEILLCLIFDKPSIVFLDDIECPRLLLIIAFLWRNFLGHRQRVSVQLIEWRIEQVIFNEDIWGCNAHFLICQLRPRQWISYLTFVRLIFRLVVFVWLSIV